MPNYCRNEIKFECTRYELEAIFDYIRESLTSYTERCVEHAKQPNGPWRIAPKRRILDFNNIVPYPEALNREDEDFEKLGREELLAKYGSLENIGKNGYNWRIKNWGTKWNVDESAYFDERDNLLVFNTAWAPALKVVAELHKKFPTVTMYYEYYEKGTGFIGGCEFVNERDFDPETHYTGRFASSLEEFHSFNEEDKKLEWKAGMPLNPWHSIYMGFKGG